MELISKIKAMFRFGVVMEETNFTLVREDGTWVSLEGRATDWMGM